MKLFSRCVILPALLLLAMQLAAENMPDAPTGELPDTPAGRLPDAPAGELPDTTAGKRAGEVIELLSGTSSFEVSEYIQNQYAPAFRDAFPMATHEALFETTRTMFGRLVIAEIRQSVRNEIGIILKAEDKDAWLDLIIQTEADEPYRIASMGLRPGARPEGYREQEKDLETAEKGGSEPKQDSEARISSLDELDRYLRDKEKENEFSGVVLIAKDGDPIFHEAYGFASKRFKVLNERDTKFNLGSCNKAFTAIAIVQLMEKGKLSLDDPIGKYLDMFPAEIAEKVTIRHLLTMRSGWGDYWSNEYFLDHITRLRSVSDHMEFIKDIPLDFEPGTNFQHCNTGFIVAGAIIENVSGMDYYEYVRKYIYEPAGMSNTDSYDKDGPVENLAMGYTNMNPSDPEGRGYGWNNMYSLPPRGTPTGGGYSTAEDLLKFDRALRGFKLLGPGYTGFYLNQFKGSPDDPYTPPDRFIRMAGAAPGICASIGLDFRSAYSIIVLSNYDYPTAMNIGSEIAGMLGIE
jgi:CubicO group peptidase (beta-lactamase class C family)